MRHHTGWRWELLLDAVALTTVIAEVFRQAFVGASPGTAVLLASIGAVAARRWFPTSSALGAVLLSAIALRDPAVALPVWILAEICLFSLPLRRGVVVTMIVAVVHGIVLYGGAIVVFGAGPLDSLALILPLWTAAAVVSGAAVRSHSDYLAAFEVNALNEAATREARVLQRVDEERLRIARDLHDSVANSIAVMTINAASASRNLERDPQRAKRELQQVRRSGAGVLKEMTDILTVLRRDTPSARDDEDRTLPTVMSIPSLIDVMRASEFSIEADLQPLPHLDPGVDAALFRVTQESLTNAQRHGASPVKISLWIDGHDVVLQISNRRIPAGSLPYASGYGLIGMRERVASAGGTVRAEPRGDRFQVEARFPLPDHGDNEVS